MSRINLAVIGSSGRMGKEIVNLAKSDPDFSLKAEISRSGPITSLDKIDQKINVVVDFSLVENFTNTLNWCVSNNVKLVSGVTGLTSRELDALKTASEKIPCLWSPNMSLGINLMAKMLGMLSGLPNFDIQLVETHHRDKKDAPSGTAVYLQDVLYKSKLKTQKPISIRGGGVYGEHEVKAMGAGETISIKHTALNRLVFAQGAVASAKWINNVTSPGLYSIKDIL